MIGRRIQDRVFAGCVMWVTFLNVNFGYQRKYSWGIQMAHHDDVTDAIETVICRKYPESCGMNWLNNKPSGPAWQMSAGQWAVVLQEILDDLQQRIAPCVAPTIAQLGNTLDKPMHAIRKLMDQNIECAEGAHP